MEVDKIVESIHGLGVAIILLFLFVTIGIAMILTAITDVMKELRKMNSGKKQ